MSDLPVNLSTSGPPETILAPEPDETLEALANALAVGADGADGGHGERAVARRAAVAGVLEADPRFLDGWARLGQLGRDPIERYAAFRVGYHRGLDRLRQNGWRGTGYVRWDHATNRGFLRALEGLRSSAAEIGETDEAERCELFLHQLDPNWPPADLD